MSSTLLLTRAEEINNQIRVGTLLLNKFLGALIGYESDKVGGGIRMRNMMKYQFDFIRELQEAAEQAGVRFDPAERTEEELQQLYGLFCQDARTYLAEFAGKHLK